MNTKKLRVIKEARAVWFSLFYFVFSFDIISPSKAENINPIVQSAYQNVLNLEFDKARDKLKFVSDNPEDNPYSLYVSNLNDALEAYITDNEALYDSFKGLQNHRLNKVARLPGHMPEKHFLDAELRIHWAFVEMKFGHYLKAFWSFKQAYASASKGKEEFPEFLPYQKSLGVLHTIFGVFPENYNWILSLLNLPGDIQVGMKELNEVSKSNSVFQLETEIYECVFKAYLLNQSEEASLSLKRLMEKPNPKATTKIVTSIVLMKSGKSQEAESILTDLEENSKSGEIIYINYLLGIINLQKGSYLRSIQYFQIFVNQFGGKNFIKDAYCKIAICHWLNAESHYLFYLDKAREEGQTIIDADKNAEKLINEDQLPNKTLLKMRYATDGGYYSEVDKIIKSTSLSQFSAESEKLEFRYRKGRLYHLTNQIQLALTEYQYVIDHTSEDTEEYFAPNSCLQTGYIYLSSKSMVKARKYFEKAIDYKDHPYKYSIDKKAKIELNLISQITGNP